MMKKAQQMTTMFPMGFSEDISVSTTSFRPCARLITLGRQGDQRGSPSSDTPLSLALLPRPPILVPWSPGLRLREEVGSLGWLGRATPATGMLTHDLSKQEADTHSPLPSQEVKEDLVELGRDSAQERYSRGGCSVL